MYTVSASSKCLLILKSCLKCQQTSPPQHNAINQEWKYSKTWLIQNSRDISNFSLYLCPKEEKFIQIYLVILKTLIIHNSKEKSVLE
jgi:hypothetical protein